YKNAEGKKAEEYQTIRKVLLASWALAAVKEGKLLEDYTKQIISDPKITSKYEKILLQATFENYEDDWLCFRLDYVGVPFTTPKRTDVVLFDTLNSIIEKAFSGLRRNFEYEPASYYFEHTYKGVESLLSLSIQQAYYDLLNLRVTELGEEVTGYSDYISGIKCDGSPFVVAIASTGKTLEGYIKECRDKGWLPLFVKKRGEPQIQSIFLPEDLKYSEFVKLCQTIVEISGEKAAFLQEIPTLMLKNWSAFEWQNGWITDGMEDRALKTLDRLSYGSTYGEEVYKKWKTVPAVFFDLNSGRPVPTQIFIEHVPLPTTPMEEKNRLKIERYIAIDPFTGLRASGTTPDEAIKNLAGCGLAPYGFYFWKGEDNTIKCQITVNLEEDKLETAMAIMGYASLGLMLTPIPGAETAGFVIGMAPMVYFTVSSASRLGAQIEHTGKLDIYNPQTWRDFGMLFTSAVGRGVIGTSMRTLGLSLMLVGDIETGRRLLTETLKQSKSKTMTEPEKKRLWQDFFTKELGPLAAALAMDFFFLKGEAYNLRYKKTLTDRAMRTPPIRPDDLEAVIATSRIYKEIGGEEIGGGITRQTIYSPGYVPIIYRRYILPDGLTIELVPEEGILRVRTPQDPNNTYIFSSFGEPPTFVRTAPNLVGEPEIVWRPGVGGKARVGGIIVTVDGEGKIITKKISPTDKARIESQIADAKKTFEKLSKGPQLIERLESDYQDLIKKTEESLTAKITKTQSPEQSTVNLFGLMNPPKSLNQIYNFYLLTLQTFRLKGGKVFFSSKVTLSPSQKEFLAKGIACAENILKTQDVFPLTPEMVKNIRKSKVLVLSDQEFNAVVGESCLGFYIPYTNLVCVPESLFRGGTLKGLAVLIHELLHSTGGRRRAHHITLEEGTTQLITQTILEKAPIVAYIHEVAQVQYLRQLLGEEVVAEFYKTRNPEILFQKIEEIYGKAGVLAIDGQPTLGLDPSTLDIKSIHSIQLAIKNAKEQGIEIPPEILDQVKAIAESIANIEAQEYIIRYAMLSVLTLTLLSSFYTIQILRQYLNKLKKQK
ncbi:MAG: hypothetical protein QXD51_00295, partial [Candidatus Anstonellales archaeon]